MKNVKIFFLCAVLATGFNLISRAADSTNQTMPTVADWTPPQNPDPQKILNEADADTLMLILAINTTCNCIRL
jgi:hypothetical protein